ncbi:hypothetical protein ABB29_00210 [Pseudoxanthomonas dokdonensis]|uniref:DUF2306 domain-containing protein n=1 Tax=Pseudoxanthomonas dokdonensis TaxID=344882 RepID=A0A0R0CZV0_9GAMM|nr:hypothetical protein ABB29_00210 [Pseudoxanthomonas dokdonensis]
MVIHWLGRFLRLATWLGLAGFGLYIALRATGRTPANFSQWRALIERLPMHTASEWIANIGIGVHFLAGMILVLAWPILFSARIRAEHRLVHRWTGRVYVSAALLAGGGGLSFILGHGAYVPAASVAFGIWGALMMSSAVMAFVHARARRFSQHRAWAIRLFALVLGSWLFDLEFRAWKDLAGGVGIGSGDTMGPFDHAILYLFFVPNLLVAECCIRNLHRPSRWPAAFRWPARLLLAAAALVFAYAIIVVSATQGGKYGKHLLSLFAG